MKNSQTHSLRTKIIFSLLLIVTLFSGLFQGYTYYKLENQLQNELNEVANSKIEHLSRDLDVPMWEIDELWIEQILHSELMDERIDAIEVSGNENILVNIDRGHVGKSHKQENTITRSRPIFHKGDKIGEVKLYVTKDLMKKRLSEKLINTLIVTILESIVLILFLWAMLKRVLLIPIETLVESTKRIADGDYSHELVILKDDEIGALGKSIYQMKSKIDSRERELHESNVELKALKEQQDFAINGTKDGLWDWNLQTNEVYFSPRWKEMLGYAEDELANKLETWETRVHPEDIEKSEQDLSYAQEIPGRFFENIHRLRHKNGSWVWILDRGQTIFDEEGKAVRMVGFHTDITKQKELEHELLEQEEMIIVQSRQAAMGEMISMIAHQWRQPISVIAMGANNMLADIAFKDVKIENFEDEAKAILKQTEFLSKTIDDFRTFFRPNKDKDEVRVVDVVVEAQQIMGKSLEYHNIELSIVDNSGETIQTYSRELLQVILNILKNAKEAIESNNIKGAYIKVSIESLDESTLMSISDNAGGIDEAVIEHIFEPYFSTKEVKTGTGLGLYMSKTIIEKHLHGTLTAANTDEGACFTVTLPKILIEIKHE